jgi:hypothetical protein
MGSGPLQGVERVLTGLVVLADDRELLARRAIPASRIIGHHYCAPEPCDELAPPHPSLSKGSARLAR